MSAVVSNYHYPIFSRLISVAYRAKSKVEQFAQYLFSQIAAMAEILFFTKPAVARFSVIFLGLGIAYVFVHSSPKTRRISLALLFIIGLVALSRFVYQEVCKAGKKTDPAFRLAYQSYASAWWRQKNHIDNQFLAYEELRRELLTEFHTFVEKGRTMKDRLENYIKGIAQPDEEKLFESITGWEAELARQEKFMKDCRSILDRMDQYRTEFSKVPDLKESRSYFTNEIVMIERQREDHLLRAEEVLTSLLKDGYAVLNQKRTTSHTSNDINLAHTASNEIDPG